MTVWHSQVFPTGGICSLANMLSGWSFLLIFILFLCYVNSLMYNFPRYSLVAPKLTRPKCKGWLKSGNI